MSESSGGQNKTSEVLFTTVPLDLFRMGNASGPKLDNIRDTDVALTEVSMPNGNKLLMVPASGGLSTFDAKNPRLKGIWWRIPAGTALPDTIRVVKDNSAWNPVAKAYITHYSLRPARLMTLAEYAQGLLELAKFAVKDAASITHPVDQKKMGQK